MAFTSKYGNGSKADDLGAGDWSDDTAKALRAAGFRSAACGDLALRVCRRQCSPRGLLTCSTVVRFGTTGMIYVGQTNAKNMPHGA